MRKRDCRKLCREIDQADLDQLTQLTVAAARHLEICRDCRMFHDERLKLRQLVGSLGAVEAPSDFEFKLRARLSRQDVGASEKPWVSGMSFGWASIAATILVLGVGGLLSRYLRPDNLPGSQVATQSSSSTITRDSSPQAVSNSLEVSPANTDRRSSSSEARTGEVSHRDDRTRKLARKTTLAARRDQIASRDFSSVPAPVFKSGQSVARVEGFPIFPIGAAFQSLKLSLDDGSGVSRTISLPTVSFGSQRVRAGSGRTASSKDAW